MSKSKIYSDNETCTAHTTLVILLKLKKKSNIIPTIYNTINIQNCKPNNMCLYQNMYQLDLLPCPIIYTQLYALLDSAILFIHMLLGLKMIIPFSISILKCIL